MAATASEAQARALRAARDDAGRASAEAAEAKGVAAKAAMDLTKALAECERLEGDLATAEDHAQFHASAR